MLHLKFYLECLYDAEDVRSKNRDAFQLSNLAEAQVAKLHVLTSPKHNDLNQLEEVDEASEDDYMLPEGQLDSRDDARRDFGHLDYLDEGSKQPDDSQQLEQAVLMYPESQNSPYLH